MKAQFHRVLSALMLSAFFGMAAAAAGPPESLDLGLVADPGTSCPANSSAIQSPTEGQGHESVWVGSWPDCGRCSDKGCGTGHRDGDPCIMPGGIPGFCFSSGLSCGEIRRSKCFCDDF